jgi:cytoskeleton protein RodZ
MPTIRRAYTGSAKGMSGQTSIGDALRRGREERGLTLEQASFQSKVPLRLVQALESDDYRLLPDPLYLTGLLRNYAGFLGLDVAGLDAEFRAAVLCPPRPAPPAPAPPPAPVVRRTRARWIAAAILAVAPLILVAFWLGARRVPDEAPSVSPAEPKTAVVAPAGGEFQGQAQRTPVGTRMAEPTATAPVAEPAAPGAEAPSAILPTAAGPGPPRAAAGHVLVARALEPTWLSVSADGQERREVLLQAGQTTSFRADGSFHVIVGNAGGVTLSLDGAPLPPLGRSGEVIRGLVLPRVTRDSPSMGAAPAARAR